MKNIYLAAPLFNESERYTNQSIYNELSSNFDVFLPQKDGILLEDLLKQGMDPQRAKQLIFETDINALNACDILVAVLDGSNIDEGVAFELGYCKANNKVCLGLQTDIRRQLPCGNNPMISESCIQIFSNIEELKCWLIMQN